MLPDPFRQGRFDQAKTLADQAARALGCRASDLAVASTGVRIAALRLAVMSRRILDDKEVDALICAAPNHWHAPATILGSGSSMTPCSSVRVKTAAKAQRPASRRRK